MSTVDPASSQDASKSDISGPRRYAAAGGVVVAPGGERVLVLVRPGREGPDGKAEVRLPKGHVEQGESIRQAALREVHEEAGLAGLQILSSLGHQAVEFDWQGQHHVRQEYYFLMRAPKAGARDRSEAQFQPVWLGWEEALSETSFEAEREWIRRARSAWEVWIERGRGQP